MEGGQKGTAPGGNIPTSPAAISCRKSEIKLSLPNETIHPFRMPNRGVRRFHGAFETTKARGKIFR
jgi:hypothetical protein